MYLVVPPGTVKQETTGHVRALSGGYDVHIDGPWSGYVLVIFPLGQLPSGYTPIVLHNASTGSQVEPFVRVGDEIVARLDSLSTVALLKCALRLSPKDVVKCLSKDGYKQVKKEVLNKTGKKLADPLSCGDVTDVVGTLLGDEPCKAGESQEDIRRFHEWQAQQAAPPPTSTRPPTQAQGPATSKDAAPTPQKSTPRPPSASPAISLSRGGAAKYGYWYSVTLSGFSPGSSVTLTCRDSASPNGFYNQTFAINSAGGAGDSTLCYSGDGPDHWVTGGGVNSNHVTWS